VKSIGEILSGLAGRLELDSGRERQSVIERWEELVGEELSRLAEPEGFRKAVLFLRADHPAAAMELRLRRSEILDRLNGAAGKVLFDSVRVTCSGASSRRKAPGR
jgi:predicted nucleic acid-binding Zn ribbon protein